MIVVKQNAMTKMAIVDFKSLVPIQIPFLLLRFALLANGHHNRTPRCVKLRTATEIRWHFGLGASKRQPAAYEQNNQSWRHRLWQDLRAVRGGLQRIWQYRNCRLR